MSFPPEVNTELDISGTTYRIVEHPAAPGLPYGQEGRQAVVYQLAAGTDLRALKVFKPRYRVPALVSLAGRLAVFADLPGLAVCRRVVLTPQRHSSLLRQYPDLTYAVLMPWMQGPTWMQVLLDRRALTAEQCLTLARALAEVLATMEQQMLAHCDLSGPNVLLPALASNPASKGSEGIALVDIEQMYGPDLRRPPVLVSGSPGYAHQTAPEGLWSAEADRFAGAILLAEMLGWCDQGLREGAWGETYFEPQEVQRDSERSARMQAVLRERWGEGTARLLKRAWHSETLADCPTFGEWLVALPEDVPAEAEPAPKRTVQPGQVAKELADEQPPITPDEESPDTEELRLARLFEDGLAAYRADRRAEARELLGEVVRLRAEYERAGVRAAAVLAELTHQARPWWRRVPLWVWALGMVILAVLVSGLAGDGWIAGLFWRATATRTATVTLRATSTPTDTATAAASSTATATSSPTDTATPHPMATSTPTPTATEIPTPPPDAVVSAESAELREGPSSVYGVLKSYEQGTELIVLARSTGKQWLKVVAPDSQVGWVRIEFLRVNVATDDLEVGSAPPSPTPEASAATALTPTPVGLPYPAPVLLEPIGQPWGRDVSPSSAFIFEWTWDGILAADEYFDMQLYCIECFDKDWAGIVWTKERTLHSNDLRIVLQSRNHGVTPNYEYGVHTCWRVQVIRGTEGQVEAVLSPPSNEGYIVIRN
jgi:hypothetical protein